MVAPHDSSIAHGDLLLSGRALALALFLWLAGLLAFERTEGPHQTRRAMPSYVVLANLGGDLREAPTSDLDTTATATALAGSAQIIRRHGVPG